jgi:Mannosyl-glycoprotein endo-beta-N-acetylglucosaminidase
MRKVRYSMGCMALIIACLPVQKVFSFDLSHYYIAQYKNLAIQEQRLWGIPASIKLSMALLESGSGQSYLATKGNNHFGIKWWNAANDGSAFIETFDDDKDRRGKPIPSRFIRFHSVDDSYRKHSEVLQRPRYAVLFTYSITDYRAWAYGLESCGYATARGYGARLIELIERYDLTQYDGLFVSVANDKLGDQLAQLDADFQDAATDSHSDNPINNDFTNEPDASFKPASGYNATPNISKGTPQYMERNDISNIEKTDFEPIKPVVTHKTPISPPTKPSIESRFTNRQGEKVHYILTEVE